MADFLIKHLENKAEEHSALKMLVNQWGFDEKLIPKALQTVGNLFPHYSRHDESHSKQILINIECLLGKDNIAKLTATDTWLLLEAAYWHDIGMVVPHKDTQDTLKDTKFQQYLDEIRNNDHHNLNGFCQHFTLDDMSKCFAGTSSPLEAVDKFRELMAEWFRRQHADRAGKIIENPWASAGISSPRTELIPARLFKLLGRICYMHGTPFKYLISPTTGLPFREKGLAQEDCHPRFVACLLRLGDLLDLDDNRFCPVMQKIAGENRPALSKAHEDKHASIRHFELNPERIEITAECETIDGYLEAFKWFDWLKQEMQNQMSRWHEIVPKRDFDPLPTLGNIEISLSGNQQLLNEGQRPQFGLDDKQATKLLSENMYSGAYPCIRELLQNAVDATLLKLWLVNQKAHPAESEIWKNPFAKETQKILQASAVNISLQETEADADTPADQSRWLLTVTDQGTGISRDDLSYMLRIGGSQANTFRQQKIKNMPEWMKPSGAFGIGFQSVFLLADKVKLTSKSIFTNEVLEITMHSPTGIQEGLVTLKQLEPDICLSYGTTIEVMFYFLKFPKRYSVPFKESITNCILETYDPLLDESLPIEAGQLAEKIQEFAMNAILPITGEFKLPITGEFKTITHKKIFPLENNLCVDNSDDAAETWRFLQNDTYQLAFIYQPELSTHSSSSCCFYRGQVFKQDNLSLPNVRVFINLMSGKAGQWLTANREKLSNNAEVEFKKNVLTALEHLVTNDLDKGISSDLKPVYSFFLQSMAIAYGNKWVELAKRLEGEWLKLNAPKNEQTYQYFFDKDDWKVGDQRQWNKDSPVTGLDLAIGYDYGYYEKEIIFIEWLKNSNHSIQVIESEDFKKGELSFAIN
ncbi:MAG: ATP-binding protein [Methylococcales bacterium]|nr:ATP-binding protein [Methylococcales bacterium]